LVQVIIAFALRCCCLLPWLLLLLLAHWRCCCPEFQHVSDQLPYLRQAAAVQAPVGAGWHLWQPPAPAGQHQTTPHDAVITDTFWADIRITYTNHMHQYSVSTQE
jgi:hypothetical protein